MIFHDWTLWPRKASAHIYGVEWDGSSTSVWTRTDEAAGFSNPSPAVNNGNGNGPVCRLWTTPQPASW